MKRLACALLVLTCAASATAEDRRLVGQWKAVTYQINGVDYPMEGLFIFTPRFYSANVRFNLSGGPIDDANGNAGPYVADGRQIVFTQWVQVHVRPGDSKEPILSRKGPDEATAYAIDGKRLILTFPSKNRYIFELLP